MEQTPDGVPCRHCGKPIFWDEYCWVHDSGWADCEVTMGGGTSLGGESSSVSIVVNPEIHQDPDYKGKHAEPAGNWS